MSSYARRLLAEGLVIIASILAAFALDTWWGRLNAQGEERNTLAALRTEFQQAGLRVDSYRRIQERILHAVGSVTDSLDAAVVRGDRTIIVADTALGLAYIPPTTTLSLGTLQGLLASGRLGIIRDPELRTALAAWGAGLEELNEEEEDLRDLAFGEMDRVLRGVMVTNGLWQSGNDLLDGTLDDEALRAVRALPATTEVLGVFHLRRSLLIHAIREFDELEQEIQDIMDLIEGQPPGGP